MESGKNQTNQLGKVNALEPGFAEAGLLLQFRKKEKKMNRLPITCTK